MFRVTARSLLGLRQSSATLILPRFYHKRHVLKLQIRVDENGIIVDACFKTFGCGSAIASSSVASGWEDELTIKNTDIAEYHSLPPVKLHCSMLAEDAIKAAVKDYVAKRAKLGANVQESSPPGKCNDDDDDSSGS